MEKINELAQEPYSPLMSDDHLASDFVKKYGHKLRYVAVHGQWMIYDGKCWRPDNTYHVRDLIRDTCRGAAEEVAAGQKHAEAVRIASAVKMTAVEKLAQADRVIAATADQWDTDLWLLNTPSGVVDLRTGETRPHRPEDYMSKITSVIPDGECPKWHEFLHQVTNGDQGLVVFLQRMIGYSLTGSTKEQALFFMYGTGGNGKGAFLNTMTAILGDYTAIANMDAFTASKNPQHTTELAMLRGARIVTAQETEEGKKWAESRIKALTGGDPITARFMRQDNFTFLPQFKLIIAGNHKPSLRSVDDAIRRRFNMVPFTVTIPRDKRDKDLQEKFKAEYAGILQWAIDGTKMWLERGLDAPAVVLAATEEYMSDEDAFGKWAAECCVLGTNGEVTLGELFNDWQDWCKRYGEYDGTSKSFNATFKNRFKELRDWQCPKTRRSGVQGIRLRGAAEVAFMPAPEEVDVMS